MSVRDAVAGDRLLAAAFDAFARHGFKRTTMADIADAADMSRPAVYLRVRNKEELLHAVAGALLADVLATARAAAGADRPVAERVAAIMLAKLSLPLGLAQCSEHAAGLLGDYHRVAPASTAAYQAELTRLTSRVLAETRAPARTCRDIAMALVSTVLGLERQLDSPELIKRVLHPLVTAVVTGLTTTHRKVP
jgi:AcrR family transcriptional regulator